MTSISPLLPVAFVGIAIIVILVVKTGLGPFDLLSRVLNGSPIHDEEIKKELGMEATDLQSVNQELRHARRLEELNGARRSDMGKNATRHNSSAFTPKRHPSWSDSVPDRVNGQTRKSQE